MELREIYEKYPKKKKIIFDTSNGCTLYSKPKISKLSSQAKRLLNREVLDIETSQYDDWVDIWLK